MKSNVMPSIVQIDAKQLKALVNEVKETVATDLIQVNKGQITSPSFGIVDMWNIHRNSKSAHLSWRSLL
jgi:hypothetical protein